MKKLIIIPAAAALLLAGCAEEIGVISGADSPAESAEAATEPLTEAAPAQEEALPEEGYDGSWINPVDADADPEEVMSHYTFDVQADGVNVYYDEKKVQFLAADCSLYADSAYDYLKYEDFDFDGYSDLFVPEVFGTANAYGKYFRFDTAKGVFEIWYTMNDSFKNGLVTVDKEKQTLNLHTKDGAVNSDNKTYKWNANQLPQLIKRMERYMNGPELVVDTFNVKNEQEILIRREVLNEETQEYEERFVHPSQIYCEKTDTAINIRLSSSDEIVQVIEGDFSGYHYIPPDDWLAREQSPPDEITAEDIDGDGYPDLRVKTGADEKKIFRFDPDSFRFEETDSY